MRCKSCDYPLWNIKARQCPECGTPFAPSQYDFVINSVQFCCPNCEQAYYGTGVKGHLVPREFHCVTCGQLLHMDLMLLRPAQGVTEDQTQTDRMPWLERKQRGFFRGWFMTVIKSMIDPASLMRGVPLDEPHGSGWFFAIVTLALIFSIGVGIPLIGLAAIMAMNGDPDWLEPMIASPLVVLGGIAAGLIWVAIWGAVAHGMLRLTGGAEYSIGRTYQAILYGIGTLSPMGVPCLGPYCGTWMLWIWWAISATLMVAQGQRAHGGRAALSVLTFPIAAVILTIALYFIAILGVVYGGFGAARTQMSTLNEVTTLTSAILQHSAANNGNGPAHALELVKTVQLATPNFCSTFTATDATQISVANTTLDKIDYLPVNKQAAEIQAAVSALPPDVVAHRCGDFVFTYHGIDLNQCDPNLWIVVFSPDPDFNAPGAFPLGTHIGLANGVTRQLSGALATELARQNRLRARAKLPPLSDPSTVTHANPACSN